MTVLSIPDDCNGKCELCGKTADVRPYGPGGKFVCFPCGMKDEDEAKRQFYKLMEGHDAVIIGGEQLPLNEPRHAEPAA